MIFFRFRAKTFPVQGDGSREFDGSSVETPPVRWDEPRPAEHLALSNGLNSDGTAFGSTYFHSHFALTDHVEMIGFFIFVKQKMTGVETHVRRASDDELEVPRFKALQEWVLCQDGFQGFRCLSPAVMTTT